MLYGLPGSHPGKLSDGSEGLNPWGVKLKKTPAFNRKLGKQPRLTKLSDPHAPSSAVSEPKKPWALAMLRRATATRAWSRIVTDGSSSSEKGGDDGRNDGTVKGRSRSKRVECKTKQAIRDAAGRCCPSLDAVVGGQQQGYLNLSGHCDHVAIPWPARGRVAFAMPSKGWVDAM